MLNSSHAKILKGAIISREIEAIEKHNKLMIQRYGLVEGERLTIKKVCLRGRDES